jgi:hypothetical protein
MSMKRGEGEKTRVSMWLVRGPKGRGRSAISDLPVAAVKANMTFEMNATAVEAARRGSGQNMNHDLEMMAQGMEVHLRRRRSETGSTNA